MSWDYLLQFLPPVFATYLVLVSGLSGKFFAARIQTFISTTSNETPEEQAQHKALVEKTLMIQNFVLSGILQTVFLNSLFAAFISSVVILRKSPYIALVASVAMLVVFIPLMNWISRLQPDHLTAMSFDRPRIKYATGCKILLVLANVALCLAIWWSNRP